MSEQDNNQIQNQQANSKQTSSQTESGKQSGQNQFGNQGSQDRYSYLGPHGEYADDDTDPDGYGPQDQFGDLDDQDPYSNLYDEDTGESAGGEGLHDVEDTLYGLAEPLAQPGDVSRQGSDKDREGTRISQDQQGYQQ